jgi:proline iminopeptidase
MKIQEGYMPFHQYQTYYRVTGDLNSDQTPLLLLHGGPGSAHNYFEVFDRLTEETGRPVVMYDQLGCGLSSMPDHDSLWKASTWVDELENLREYLKLKKVDLLGQSWGGMLAIIYLCDHHPKGVEKLILSSTLSDASLWAQEQHRMIKFMSLEDQHAIEIAEKTGNFNDPKYLLANRHFMLQHAGGPVTKDSPEFMKRAKNSGDRSYQVAWGPNEYSPTGNLKDYNYTDKLQNIQIPTLITSGTDDLCTPLIAKTMFDQIPNCEWALFPHSRHMAFIDETEDYLERLSNFLNINS